ncbi:uncharacterized protein LOC143427174 [Xylocopa sonorina]|uniref:uncharacterized protein LOC143427174 n=1 Tax=Xylocopa sonorina TaxID=1818115 RepID=UPI00403A87EF
MLIDYKRKWTCTTFKINGPNINSYDMCYSDEITRRSIAEAACRDPSKGQTLDYEYDPMSVRNTYCCANRGTCPAAILNSSRQSPWYCKFIKPFVFCVITSLLAMSVSHLCDKYSASTTFKAIRSDLVNLRTHLNTLSMEVKNVMETRDDLKSKLKEVGYLIPKMSEAILYLRNEVSEGKKQLSCISILLYLHLRDGKRGHLSIFSRMRATRRNRENTRPVSAH